MKKFTFLSIMGCIMLIFPACSSDEGEPASESLVTHNRIVLGNQNHVQIGSFVNLYSGKIYTIREAFENQGQIDLVFFHDDPSNAPCLVSPSAVAQYTTIDNKIQTDPQHGLAKWELLTTMEIGVTDITAGQFEGVKSYPELKTLIDKDNHVTVKGEYQISAGKVYKFKTGNKKWGLISIIALDGNAKTSGTVAMDVKIQK